MEEYKATSKFRHLNEYILIQLAHKTQEVFQKLSNSCKNYTNASPKFVNSNS